MGHVHLNVTDIDFYQDRAYCTGYWGGMFVLKGVQAAQPTLEACARTTSRG